MHISQSYCMQTLNTYGKTESYAHTIVITLQLLRLTLTLSSVSLSRTVLVRAQPPGESALIILVSDRDTT
jgi:hypothetical protein